MIVHIVLFKWKSEVTKSQIDEIFSGIKSMKSKVDGIGDIFCGENLSKYGKGYTHVIVVVAKDKDSLEAYRQHQYHRDISVKIDSMEESSLAADILDKN